MTYTAPRTPAEPHYDLAESGLADLGRVGFDDAGRTAGVLVALTHATLAIAARLARTRMESGPSVRRLRAIETPVDGFGGASLSA
jgi:hypothetical protein